MNYQEFLNDVKEHISANLDPDTRLSIQTVTKNNGIQYDGLVIMRPKINISPTIYLNPYYHRYLNGVSLEDIYTDILETYRRCLPEHNFDISFFLDYAKVRQRIIPKVINYEKNRNLLDQIPHVRHLDLAVIFQCLINSSREEHASILIYNHHLAYWSRTTEDLYRAAFQNASLLLPYKLTSMKDILSDYFLPLDKEDSSDSNLPMYVLTNRKRINGAVCFLYPEVLQKISGQFCQDLIILPSSIHETILIPIAGISDLSHFPAMVREVNETQVTDDEQLSDHAYLYSRRTGSLQIL